MKGFVRGVTLSVTFVLSACGDDGLDDGGSPSDGGVDGARSDGSGGSSAGEPTALAGITAAHNMVRAMVDTTGLAGGPLPPMSWDPDLAAHAATYAAMCKDGDGNGLVDHSPSSYRQNAAGYTYIGENIFASSSPTASPTQAVSVWAGEKANFTYPTGCSGVCGHYTQVVWRSSVNLGCAHQTCSSLTYKGTILCMYGPGGNSGGAPY